MGVPRISVVIRARDEAAAIGRCLDLVAAQRLEGPPPEVIVVDNASGDATAAIARSAGTRVIGIGRGEFSFGRALNRGVAAASAPIVVALSAHAFPDDDAWLARMLGAFDDPGVACASGDRYRPDGTRLERAVRIDAAAVRHWPEWGFSNAAGGFRRALWAQRPFREDLPGCEDKEWARHWILQGAGVCLLDPALTVEHDHTHDPLRSIYRRAHREARGYAMFLDRPQPTPGALAREWWSDTRFYARPWRARLSHRRMARLLGAYAGAREGLRVEQLQPV